MKPQLYIQHSAAKPLLFLVLKLLLLLLLLLILQRRTPQLLVCCPPCHADHSAAALASKRCSFRLLQLPWAQNGWRAPSLLRGQGMLLLEA